MTEIELKEMRDWWRLLHSCLATEFAVEDDPKAIRKRLVKEFELALTHVRIEDAGSPSKV